MNEAVVNLVDPELSLPEPAHADMRLRLLRRVFQCFPENQNQITRMQLGQTPLFANAEQLGQGQRTWQCDAAFVIEPNLAAILVIRDGTHAVSEGDEDEIGRARRLQLPADSPQPAERAECDARCHGMTRVVQGCRLSARVCSRVLSPRRQRMRLVASRIKFS